MCVSLTVDCIKNKHLVIIISYLTNKFSVQLKQFGIMEQEKEDPLEMCEAWVQVAVPRTSPPSLTIISLNKVKAMIKTYPFIREDTEKLKIKRGLKNLLDLPLQFVPDLIRCVISNLQVCIVLKAKQLIVKP